MEDNKKTKAQFINELEKLRKRNAELEAEITLSEQAGEKQQERNERFQNIFKSVNEHTLLEEKVRE